MSTTIGIGVPVPIMLPVTGTWTLPFATYLFLLTGRVGVQRSQSKQPFGTNSTDNQLEVAVRAHGNFLENVPLALTLAAIAELNGANRRVLNGALAALLAFRIMHVELGLKSENNLGKGRLYGHAGTQGFIVGIAAYSAWLVKGYWGF